MQGAWVWVIACATVIAVVLTGVVLVALWQTGVIFARSKDEAVLRKPPPPKEDKKAPAEPKEEPAAADEPGATDRSLEIVPLPEPTESQIRALVSAWLPDAPAQDAPARGAADVRTGDVAFDEWECRRSVLPCAVDLQPEDYFGYAIDTAGAIAVVGAPGVAAGAGCVFVYACQTPTQTLASPGTAGERFGLNCALSSTGATLAVQSARGVHIYRRSDGSYTLEKTLELGEDFHVLCANPDGCLWVSNQTGGAMQIYERGTDADWQHACTADFLAMDVSYEPETGHAWVASASGLRHWSRDQHAQWTENANWMPERALTTVRHFTSDQGQRMLALGEAHADVLTLVSAEDPHAQIDRVSIPGGRAANTNALFADHVLWWDAMRCLVVTVPLDTLRGMRSCGCTLAYQLDGATLKPVCMLRGAPEEPSAQFGSNVKLLDNAILVSASGANAARGAVWVFEK